jgi:hypothetical protein
MIDDMASLKQAMQQMDAEDVAVAHAARDRVAQILSHDRLSFAKIGELIEERRLLLRPTIIASIKRMDQPDGLGDAAFRDTVASLRKEGQSFGQIAEALELGGEIRPRYEAVRGVLHPAEPESGRDIPQRDALSYPLRHPVRFLAIAVLAFVLFNTLRESDWTSWHLPGYRAGLGANRQRADIATPSAGPSARPPGEAAAPPAPPAPSSVSPSGPASPASQSAGAASPSAPPAAAATQSANQPALATPSPTVPAGAPAFVAPPSSAAANDRPRTARPRAFNDFMPDRIRRNSRSAGPCMGGIGGCYWGGGQY